MPRSIRYLAAVLLLGCSGVARDVASDAAAANGNPSIVSTPPADEGDASPPPVPTSLDDASSPSADDAAPSSPRPDAASSSGFAHPGVIDSKSQLDFVKAKIAAGADPWLSAFTAASTSSSASLSYTPSPVANVVCGPYSNPDIGCSAEKDDAIAAYTHALLWYFTGEIAHAQKATEIMNAWSAVLTEHTDSNAPLQSAWVGSVWPRAAEIIRYSSGGWSTADVTQFSAMLRNVYLPEVVNGDPKENGNWELSMAEATTAIGVFLDDETTFQKGISLWRGRVPAYVYLASDGPTPVLPPGGVVTASKLASFWYGQTQLVNGVAQETCRDLGHVQYGLAAIINVAETAHLQGIDLYSEQATRITAGLEFHAQFLDGAAVPSWLCSGTLNAVTPDPMWEIALNAYATRLGLPLPSTQALVTKIRPTATDHHMDWETLTHAGVGN